MWRQTVLATVCSLLLVFPWALAGAQPAPIHKGEPSVDQYGDPLPPHALLRIGTTRLRPNVDNGGRINAMAFTKDGKRLVTIRDWNGGLVWDAVTGKKMLAFGVKPGVVQVRYAISADGSRAAIIESEKVCRFFDTASGKEIGSATGDWDRLIWDLRFSPNNKLLGVLRLLDIPKADVAVWDVATGSKRWQSPGGTFAFTPDEKMIMCAPRPGTKLDLEQLHFLPLLYFDAAQGLKSEYPSPIQLPINRGPSFAADGKQFTFSSDGKLLAARKYSRQFMLWDFTTGKLLHEPKIADDKIADDMVNCVCFSPNDKWIITGSAEGHVRLWDVVTGNMQREFVGYENDILALAVSPDSKCVAASGIDDTLRIWDVDSGKQLFDFEGHRMRNVQARFGSNGKTIVSICGFSPAGVTADQRTYRIWDATTGKPLKRVELSRKDFLRLCLCGDGNNFFVIEAGKITKRSLNGGKTEEVTGFPANYANYRCSSDGRYLAGHTDDFWGRKNDELVTSNTLKVVDTTTGKEVLAFEGRKGEQFDCRFTEDGHYLTVHSFRYETDGSMGGRSNMELKETFLRIWDMQTGRTTSEEHLLEQKHNGDFRWPGGDSLSPDRTLALTRGKDSVELRDLTTNATLARFPATGSECESWAFSRDGKFIAVGDQKGRIVLWSVSLGRLRNEPGISSVAGAAPRSRFAFHSRLLATLEGHAAAVTSVQFSPDGSKLLSGSNDTTIVLWNIAEWTAPAATPK